jgi:hypothetical protein
MFEDLDLVVKAARMKVGSCQQRDLLDMALRVLRRFDCAIPFAHRAETCMHYLWEWRLLKS